MKAVDAVAHLFGHPTDSAANNRLAVGERLLDHHRRVLPPDRRHDDPIDLLHPLGQLRLLIRADPAQDALDDQRLSKRLNQFLKPRGLRFEVSAVDLNDHLCAELWGDEMDRLKQDFDALEFGNLAEEAEPCPYAEAEPCEL